MIIHQQDVCHADRSCCSLAMLMQRCLGMLQHSQPQEISAGYVTACRRILLDLAVRSGATLANLAAGQLHPSLPPADAFTDIYAFQVRGRPQRTSRAGTLLHWQQRFIVGPTRLNFVPKDCCAVLAADHYVQARRSNMHPQTLGSVMLCDWH